MTKKLLNESTPSDQAHALGLEYGGFGGWIDPATRQVKAKTVDGKLVRVEDEEEAESNDDLGRLVVLDFEDELLYVDLKQKNPTVEKLIYLIKSVVKTGSDIIIMHGRNSEKKVAVFLKKIGVTAGPTLVPYGSSEPGRKEKLVEKKIKAGYSEIHYLDSDPVAIHAVESLKAPYNKLKMKLETHKLPEIGHNAVPRTPTADSERETP